MSTGDPVCPGCGLMNCQSIYSGTPCGWTPNVGQATTYGLPANILNDPRDARITALEAALRTAMEEVAGWRCGGIRFMDNAPGYGPQSIGIQKLRYFECPKATDANPLCREMAKELCRSVLGEVRKC